MRIVSDGTPQGTVVYDDSSMPMMNVTRIEILPITPGEMVQVRITFLDVELDLKAEVVPGVVDG